MKLSFDEIKNWAEFEDLTASYFRLQENYDIEVAQSADNSPDDRRNIILTVKYDSPILYTLLDSYGGTTVKSVGMNKVWLSNL